MLQMLRAAGARHAVLGSLSLAGSEFALDLQIHDHDKKTAMAIRAATPAGLVLPAIEALRQALLGADQARSPAQGLHSRPLPSIELFARAKHSLAINRHAAWLRALELLRQLDPEFPRLELELLRAQARCGSDDAPLTAARLLDAARRDHDQALEAEARQCLGTLNLVKGQVREAAQSFEQALTLGRSCMPPHWQGHTLALLASVECRLGELHSLSAHLDEAQAIFTRIGSHWGLLTVLWVRAVMASLSGHAEQSIRWNRKLVKVARRLHANTALASVCCNLAGELLYADRLEEARECVEEATATALAIEANLSMLSNVANMHCLLHRLQDRPDAAAELLSLLPQPAAVQEDGFIWQAHGHAAMAAGRIDDAADCFVQSAATCRRHGNRAAEVPLLPWLVEALVLSDRLPAAQAELDRAQAQAHLQDEATTANLLYPRALLARRRQQEPEAKALLARLQTAPAALPLFRRLGQELSAAPGDAQGEPPRPAAPSNAEMRRHYRFANCMLDMERRELWVDGRRQTTAPKPFEVLVHLYRNRHRLVTQDELLDTVWHKAAGSPELVAQAIAKIRQALQRGKTHAVRIQTVYGKGYRLLAEAQAEPDDDSAAALLSDLHPVQERLLAVVPLPTGKLGVGVPDPDAACPLEVIGYTLAMHAQLKRMSAAELQTCIASAAAATPEALAAAIGARHSHAHLLFARLERRNDTLMLEYVSISPAGRIEGSLHDRSPTALGRRLAARLLRLHAGTPPAHAQAAEEGAWMTQMLDLASRAAEVHRWGEARQILDVVLDQDPDHDLATALKARVDAGR
jgi:DNA-binding winged helix-turn-helix (wHTH) protein